MVNPKILIVQPEIYMWGGAERQIAHLCNYLSEHNYPNAVLTMRAIPEFKQALKETRIIETGNDINRMMNVLHNIMRYYDIINPHNHPCELMIAPKRMPVVWQCNEPPIETLRGMKLDSNQVNLVGRYITKAVVITDYDAERFEILYGFKPEINYPGVRYDFFEKKRKTEDKYNIKDKFVILEAGYITFTKNQVAAVEILAKVKKQIPNAVLVLAGYDKDDYKFQVQSKALELGVDDSVIFTGFIEKDEDMRDLYNIADIYIGPFLDQGGWATTFEAIVAGCPVIVSPKFVATNLIKEHKLGVVAEIEDFEGWIFAIADDMMNKRKETRKAGKWIKNNLRWGKFGERYCKIFDEVWHENEYSYNND